MGPVILKFTLAAIFLVAVLAVFRAMHRGDGGKGAAHLLSSLEPAEAARQLLNSTQDPEKLKEDFRAFFGDVQQQDRWKKAAVGSDPGSQADIAMAVAKFGDESGRSWLFAAWEHNDPGLQLAVSRALSATADPHSLKRLLPLLHSPRAGLPTRAAEVVLSLGEQAVEPLVAYLRKTDQGKETIIQLLGEMQDHRAVAALIDCLSHSSESVRKEAVIALGKLGDTPEITTALLASLQDESWQVRAQAARVAGVLGVKEAAPALETLSRDSRWEVSTHACKALVALGGDRGAGS